MIISVDDLKKQVTFKGWTDERIRMKLDSIEQVIRSYTHNNFQNRGIRAHCSVAANEITCSIPGLNAGDTIMITESKYNEGLYVINSVDIGTITTDHDLIDEERVLLTKVEYPADVVECAIKLIEWEQEYGGKVGIKSETLSRHSVTYEDSATLYMGYPVGILNGLKLHMKARF